MGSVQAAMAPPGDSLEVSDFLMADEMEYFVGLLASAAHQRMKILALGGSTDPIRSAKVRSSYKADAAAP
jgi:hypothetical protein